MHSRGILHGLTLLSLFELISSSSAYCPVDELNVVLTTTCCSHCPPGLQQQDCQHDEFCYRNPNSSLEVSPFDAFGRCCPRPKNLDSMCPYGKPFLDGEYCCMNCGWMQVAGNLSGPCPDGFMCATDPMDRRHAVCCPQVPQEYTFSQCEGSWLGFVIYNGFIYETKSVTGTIKHGLVLSQTTNESASIDGVCCRQIGSSGAYGMIISGPHLHSDTHVKCFYDRLANSVWSTERLKNLLLEFPQNSSRWQPAYVIETNHGEDTPGFSFDVDPRFHANAKWIWARRDGAEFVSPESTLLADECIWCKVQLTDKTDVRELVGVYANQGLKALGGFIELFGLYNSTLFKIHFDLYSDHPDCKSITVKFASSGKSGANEEIYFDLVTKSYGADVRFCRQVGSPGGDCSPPFVVEDPRLTLCGQYRSVWVSITYGFVQFGIAFGIPDSEEQLTVWTGWVGNKFESLNRLSLTKSSRMRLFRSPSENRCLFKAQEADELEPCGDGYISDEKACFSCGCCYYPHLLPGRVYQNTTLCYRSLSSRHSKGVDQSSSVECHRSFEKVIGHFAFVIENNHTFLLNETLLVKVLLQNSIRNILVRILFENFVFAENVTMTRANVRIPEGTTFSYIGSVPVRFNHSGKHILVAEIVGKEKDRLQKQLTVSVGKLTDIVSIALETCSTNRTVALFALIFMGFDEKIMRMHLDFGDGTVLNKVEVDQPVKRPSWVRSDLLGEIVVVEHVYATTNVFTATLAVSSLNNGSVLTVQERRVFATLCTRDLSSFGKMIVFDSGFDQSYNLHDQVSLRVFLSDEIVSQQLSGFHLHWFCSTDSNWEFSPTSPDDDIPPESVQCFQQKVWLDSYAQMNKSRPESILTFPARELRFRDVPQSYYFHIVITKSGHNFTRSTSPGTISLIRASPPELSINCFGNCGHNFNPSEAMVLYAYCQNCYPGETLVLDWSVGQSASGTSQARTFDLKAGTIVYDRYFVIKSNGLKGLKKGMEYLVKVSARRLDGATGDASYDVTVKSPAELIMRYSKAAEEEIIYIHRDYLALLSIPIALIVGVIIGVVIRRKRDKVAPATKSSQETLNQEASHGKDEENKDDSAGDSAKASLEQPSTASQQ